jgi:hypothetical protein
MPNALRLGEIYEKVLSRPANYLAPLKGLRPYWR